MPLSNQDPSCNQPAAAGFATTRWSVVLAAKDHAAPEARAAWATLCQSYWYPLYVFIRREGHPAEQAQDLTQEFFTRLLEKDFLGAVDRAKGKFRSFLLAACKHFVANQRAKNDALKRGGGWRRVPLDFDAAERRYLREPAHTLAAEKLYERRWALALLEQVLARLRQEAEANNKEDHFRHLKDFLQGDAAAAPYAETAQALGMSEGAVKVAVHRLRRRYRDLLREEIARTVERPEEVEEEIRDLFAALGG